jgi:predicted ATP-grasp superfamily ATP-dependent carboligase
MNILITPGTWTASLTIMESLSRKGHNVFLVDHDSYCVGFRSKHCKKGIVVPHETNSEAYLKAIENIVETRNFDLLIPTGDLSTEIISANRERLLPYVRLLLPPAELVELARYKDRAYEFALKNDILIPKTYFPKSLRDVESIAQYLIFPCVVKKPRGTANKGNTYFDDRESLIRDYRNLVSEDGWPVIQEYIKGDFYGFLAVAYQGEVLDGLMYKTFQQYTTGGMPPYCWSVTDTALIETAKRIVKKLKWTGAINIDFLRGEDGRLRMLEINPRLSGSLTFAHHLGVDLTGTYLALALGVPKKSPIVPSYKPNAIFRYFLPSEIIYVINKKASFFKMFLNFFNFKMKTDITWSDPGLITSHLWHVWWYHQDRIKGGGTSIELAKTSPSTNTVKDQELIPASRS